MAVLLSFVSVCVSVLNVVTTLTGHSLSKQCCEVQVLLEKVIKKTLKNFLSHVSDFISHSFINSFYLTQTACAYMQLQKQ